MIMPDMEISGLHDTAVLWPASTYDNYGELTIGSPVEIPCRWVESKRETRDAQGNIVVIDATVIVKQDIAIGSQMFLGTLNAWYGTGTGSGLEPNNLMVVHSFSKTEDIKGRAIRRSVNLMRYRDDQQ